MTTQGTIRGTETSLGSVRERFGGIDTPAALMGMFTALGVLAFLGALIAAGAGTLEYQLNMFDIEGNAQELSTIGVVAAVIVVLASFFVGGIAAGRIARYDGGINGIAAALWMLLLVAVFAALGAFIGEEYNAFRQAGLPDWFSQLRLSSDEVTTLGIIAAIASVVAMFLGGYVGGKIGEMYHRKVDAALADRTVPVAATEHEAVVAHDEPVNDITGDERI